MSRVMEGAPVIDRMLEAGIDEMGLVAHLRRVQVDDLELKRATFQRKVDLITRLQAEQQGPVHMLDEISKALPDFVWLNGLDETAGRLVFTGQSNSLSAVADFIAALQRSGWFPVVDLVSSKESNNIVTFSLSSTFKNPEEPKAPEAPGSAPAVK